MSVQQDKFKVIADKIREKTGTTEGIKPNDFANKIDDVYEQGKTDENKVWWDIITVNGTRTFLEYMFRNWDCEYIRPPYKLTAKIAPNITQSRAMHVFSHNPSLLCVEKEYFDFSECTTSDTSSNVGLYYTFSRCPKLKYIEDIGLPAGYLYNTYASCSSLEKIEMIRMNKSTGNYQAFSGCNSLVYVRFEGEIGKSITFSSSPLDKDSITDIINHLCADTDVTGQTLTLNLDAVKKAFETSEGANNGNASKEWADLKATKTNWTISAI